MRGIILRVRETKKDIAYQKIKKLITDREFIKNHTISENSLSKRLKMSRTPVREALLQLQMEGFLKIVPNKGIVVTETSINEVRDIYDMRIAIEEFVLRELAGNLEDHHFEYLESLLKEQEECLKTTDTTRYLKLDREFHEFLFRTYSNPMIVDYMSKMRDRLHSINYRMLESNDNMRLFCREHARIIEALRSNDKEKAVQEMDIHLKGGKTRLL